MATDAARRRKWELYRERFPQIFWARVDKSGGPDACWPYRGSRRKAGYGRLVISGKYELAHRVAYRLTHDDLPDDVIVRHSCDNPPCCNPDHLRKGDHLANMADRLDRGHYASGADHPMARLTWAAVLRIRDRAATGETATSLAQEFGVSLSAAARVISGQTWKLRSTP